MQVHWSKKAAVGSNFGAYGGYAGLERRDVPTSRRPHVVTSQRRDVGSTIVQVNKRQRRDVATSRRQCEFYFPNIKSKWRRGFGASGGVRTRAQNSRTGVTPTSKKCP